MVFSKIKILFISLASLLCLLHSAHKVSDQIHANGAPNLFKLERFSPSYLNVHVVWQTLKSQRQSKGMGTYVESFEADGRIYPSRPGRWTLVVNGLSTEVSFFYDEKLSHGTLFCSRLDFIRLLKVDQGVPSAAVDSESLATNEISGNLMFTVAPQPNRQLETIYQSPDDDLFLLKASINLNGYLKK